MALRTLFTLFALATTTACSLVIDNNASQCGADSDCARFPGTTCDAREHLCKEVIVDAGNGGAPPLDSGDDRGPSCQETNGCYACTPTSDRQFGNACTDAPCRPFDNRTRLRKLPEDGGLTPLPITDAQAKPQ